MNIQDIAKIEKEFLLSTDVAEYLGYNPQNIRVQAQKDASKLGFPVIVVGTRIKIPKEAFIKFIGG